MQEPKQVPEPNPHFAPWVVVFNLSLFWREKKKDIIRDGLIHIFINLSVEH